MSGEMNLENGLFAKLKTVRCESLLEKLDLRLETLQQGSWMLAATIIAGIFNYLSNVFVGRMLGPADYSTFASILSLSMILTVAAGVVQTVVTSYVAPFRDQGALEEVSALLRSLIRQLLPWGIGGALILSLVSRPLAGFLQIASPVPIIIVSLFLIPTTVLPVVNGTLRGLQRFSALGWTQISIAIFRLIAAIGLVALGLGASGAIGSLPLSSLGTTAVGLLLLRDVLRQRDSGTAPDLAGVLEFSAHTVLVTVCFAVLTNIDVIVVKSRLSPTEAGQYSAMATVGRITLWLSTAMVTLLLPKAAALHARGESTTAMLRRSLLVLGILCGSVTGAFLLLPSFIVRILFGEQFLDTASLLGPYGLAMSFYSLVNAWLFYYLAVKEYRYVYILALGTGSLVGLLALFGTNPTQVVIILTGIGIALYVGGELLLHERRISA